MSEPDRIDEQDRHLTALTTQPLLIAQDALCHDRGDIPAQTLHRLLGSAELILKVHCALPLVYNVTHSHRGVPPRSPHGWSAT